jgi:hypothetical protein
LAPENGQIEKGELKIIQLSFAFIRKACDLGNKKENSCTLPKGKR